jgi:predicted ATPase/class 3 adenylate cyclase/DNA-binding CsgD family transcriptional regulator
VQAGAVVQPPSGTVTFLLTDVEASTQAWEADPLAASAAVLRQEEIIAEAVARHGGFRPVEQGEGDSIVAAFARASDAVSAALSAQLTLAGEDWRTAAPVRVRMALHTGEAESQSGRYAGAAIIRAARLRGAAHGGQTLLSRAAAELAGDELPPGAALVDLGTHRLRDLVRAEHVFQLSHPDLPLGFPPLRSLDRVANNLPVQLTSFVGREEELAQVAAVLSEVRLLTLTGAGGCGKTRLAAHTAALVAHTYPGGVWWVDLAPLRSGSAVSAAALSAMGLREHPACTPVEQLAGHLDSAPALLVFDNCEHVLDDVVALVEPLLGRGPRLTVLATSREPLGVPGETTWRVPPLATPAATSRPALESLGTYDAIALFVERARQARPNFTVDNDNAPAVADICIGLDGIPLAIELAAARVRVLSPQQIRAGLDDRFRLLTAPATRAATRHHTLSASVEWSYDLLGEPERRLLQRLSVFAGGFTLDAAETVCAGAGIDALRILDLLTSLVDKSLVVADEGRSTIRYRLLETIRQFAAACLGAEANRSPEPAALHDAHLAFFRRLAAEAEERFLADDGLTGQLEAEHDNLRAALDWALRRENAEAAADLVVGLAHLWLGRGLLREAATWFDRVLRHPAVTGSPARHRAVWARGLMAVIDGRPDPALELASEVAEWARSVGDARYVARAQTIVGVVTVMADPVAGERILEDAIATADDASDPISSVLGRLVRLVSALHRDDHGLLAEHLNEGRPAFESASGQMQAMYHAFCGWSDVRLGRLEAARHHAAMASTLAERYGDAVFAGALFVLLQALIELAAGRAEAAAALLEPVLREPRSAGPTREDPMLTGAWACVLAHRGQIEKAEAAMAEGVRLAVELGDGLQIAFCHAWHAGVLRLGGNVSQARTAAQTLLDHARQQHNASFEAVALRELGALATLDEDLEVADDLTHTALALSDDAGLLPDVAVGLACAACIAAAEESWEEAVRLFGAAEAARQQLGTVLAPWDEQAVGTALEGVHRALDGQTFEAVWSQGQALSLGEAVAYAQRGRGERKRPTTGWASLTPMERQVVELLSGGLRNAEIAERLFIAPSTVKTHLGHAFAKLGVSTRAELAVLAAARKP